MIFSWLCLFSCFDIIVIITFICATIYTIYKTKSYGHKIRDLQKEIDNMNCEVVEDESEKH